MRRDAAGRRSGEDRECQCMIFFVRMILWGTRNVNVAAHADRAVSTPLLAPDSIGGMISPAVP